jgi:NAD(P)-dependent dehydrogenase (short-subunit alcohol dehydrogenase family)
MDRKRFVGKVVLVTGGTSGIGLAAAQAFAEEGARVVLTGRDAGRLEAARKTVGKEARAVVSDIADPSDSARLTASIGREYGRIDVIFLNAGIPGSTPVATVTEAQFDAILQTNFKGPYFLIQSALPLLPQGATVVLTGSFAAHSGMPGSSVYAASKAALASLARTLSGELLARGIRCNAIVPGAIETPIWNKMLPADHVDPVKRTLSAHIPMQRFGTAAEAAQAVLFLASEQSSYVAGMELFVDGGMKELGSEKLLRMQ